MKSDTSDRFYGYEPIPACPGMFKCVGFLDKYSAWSAPELMARYPGLKVRVGYRGDRLTEAGLNGPMVPVNDWD